MKKKLLILLIFPFSLLYSQEVNYHDNGSIKDSLVKHKDGLSEYFVFQKNKKLTYHYKEFFDEENEIIAKLSEYHLYSGELQIERIIDKSLRNIGLYIFYHDNGKIKRQGNYNKEHVQIGEWNEYYEDGALLSQSIYDENGETLFQKNVSPEGIPYFESRFLESKKLYEYKSYHSNGNVDNISYVNSEGIHFGDYIEYYDDGKQIFTIGNYNDKGKKNGEWKFYHENGILAWTENYQTNGTMNCKNFHENGQLKSKGNKTYKGNEIGIWTFYDTSGRVTEVKDYGNN